MKNPLYRAIFWGFVALMIIFVEILAFPSLMNMKNDLCIPSAVASIIFAVIFFTQSVNKVFKYLKKI